MKRIIISTTTPSTVADSEILMHRRRSQIPKINTSAPLTGPSKQQGYLKSKCVYNDYTNPNTSPKTLTTLTRTLTDRHDRDLYKDISYVIRSFNTTDNNALSRETCVLRHQSWGSWGVATPQILGRGSWGSQGVEDGS